MIKHYKNILERDKTNPHPKQGDCCVVHSLDEYFMYYKGAWYEYPEMPKVIKELQANYRSLSFWGKLKYNLKMLYETL